MVTYLYSQLDWVCDVCAMSGLMNLKAQSEYYAYLAED